MENLLIYFIKVNGLIVLFYLMYVLLLRKETFFTSNRWYLILGLLLSLLLPLITFTKTIWIEPEPIVYESTAPILSSNFETIPLEETTFDWTLLVLGTYGAIVTLVLIRIGVELFSFYRRIQKQNKQKESGYTLVNSNFAENPFSFFNYIVINQNMFTEEELQHILTHESVHVKQRHSFDVLFGKIFCALFWINPIIWLYRKAMLQNIEFIADNETFQQIENKYQYQRTLLKVVTHQHNLSITNQFYQSLIKKRIVMLHTNQSHKKNVWKYATILPLLVGFMLLFQIETIAQVKEVIISKSLATQVIEFIINKNTTDIEIKEETDLLKKEYGIELKISKIKRNAKNEIIAFDAKFEDSDKTSGKISIKGAEAIEPIRFFKEINGKGNIGFDRNNTSTVFAKMNADKLQWNDAQTIEIKKSDNDEAIYIINGKEYSKEEMKDKIVELDGAIEMNKDEKSGKKTMLFKGNSTISDEPKTIIYLDEKVISKDEMGKIDTEIYINGKKATKEELDRIERENIESVNVNNNNGKKSIEIQKKNIKAIPGGSGTEVEIELEKSKIELEKAKAEMEKAKAEMQKAKAEMEKNKSNKIIETENGDQSVIYGGNRLKIPGEPSVKIENGKLDIFVNGKKLKNAEDFLTMNHDKIYYIKATEKETNENNVIVVKKIEVKIK